MTVTATTTNRYSIVGANESFRRLVLHLDPFQTNPMTKYLSQAYLVLLSSVLASCADTGGGLTRSDRIRMSEHLNQHAVVVDRTAFAGLSDAERASQMLAAIDSIVQRVPPEQRDAMRRLLEHPKPGSLYSGSSDPEIARLLGVIASLRAAGDASVAQRQSDQLASDNTLKTGVEVTVALVSTLPTNVRARVIRRPDDGGTPLVLLADDADASDVALGLTVAASSKQRFGVTPDKEHIVDYRSKGHRVGPTNTVHSTVLDQLRAASLWDIPGVGQVKATRVMTHPRAQP